VRRGQSLRIAIGGNRLSGARVATSDPELDISSLTAATTGVSFTLSASAAAALGARVFTVVHLDRQRDLLADDRAATAGAELCAVAGDAEAGQTQEVTLTLSNPDSVAHSLSLAIANTAVASVSTASITLLPGQTSAVFSVSAIASGTTALNVGSPTLGPTALGIYVSAPFAGESAAYAPLVGSLFGRWTSPRLYGAGSLPARAGRSEPCGRTVHGTERRVFRPEAAGKWGAWSVHSWRQTSASSVNDKARRIREEKVK
jgi:hypothetical protein